MKNRLLEEYIRFIIFEKIRSVKKNSPFGSRFDFKKFRSLDNIEFMRGYADSFLQVLGEGSSRVAYALSSNKVLKIALNGKGVDQNIAELDVFTNPATKPMVAKVQDYDPEYRWIIADSVRIFNSEEEFEKETGVNFKEFVEDIKQSLIRKQQPESDLAVSTLKTIMSSNLMLGDVARIEHWGKSSDGRVVLLDYGFTKEVWQLHYSSKPKQKKLPMSPKKKLVRHDTSDTKKIDVMAHMPSLDFEDDATVPLKK